MYQIKFCNFVPVRQKNANMNRIKEALESKGIGQTELANRLGKLSTWSICMPLIRCNLLFLYCIGLQTS